MRRTIDLTLSVTGLFALISAAGCSAEPEGGGGGPVTMFGQSGTTGVAPGGGGASGGTGVTGGAGTTGLTGEGQGGANFNAGVSGAGSVGAAGTGPVVDVVNEPGLGFFKSGEWEGYAWTAIETDPVAGATVRTPTDFTTLPDGDPYCLSGTVAADPPSTPTAPDGYQGFAMLGFNINQAGVPAVEGQEPPVETAVPTGTGIALTFSQTVGPLRIQIQAPNPALAANRWCATVPPADAEGRAFIPYTSLLQDCYATPPGPSYQAAGRPALEAVSFLVPGDVEPTPFAFCVDGFADGASAADAPDSISGGGLISGTLATNFGRRRVRGTDGRLYVVQNNAWNTAAVEGNHRVQFEGNSFSVVQQSNGGQGSIPISFPSIFVGRNGFQGVGNENATTDTDGLPRAINQITSIQSTFNTNAGSVSGEYNATYDIWFANGAPAQAGYDDAEAAFLMVWTHKPGGKNPIGINPFANDVTIAGAPGTWDIWVGRRGENGAEDNLNNNAPVISYTPNATLTNFSANLMLFINDAVQRSNAGGLQGFQFPATLTLTDIFGGFEIWSGGQNLSVSEFTVNVQPPPP
jgi:hypothetical protein